jgi:hypothetical protein
VLFLHAECDFYTESVISIRTFGEKHECDFNAQFGFGDTHGCDFNTHKSDFYTKNAISTHRVWFYTQTVIFTHTSVILTRMRVNMTLTSMIKMRSSVIYTRRV